MDATSDNITVVEAGRRGGLSTARRHGVEHLRRIGIKGAQRQHQRHSAVDFQAWGRLGGRPRKLTLKELVEEAPQERRPTRGPAGVSSTVTQIR